MLGAGVGHTPRCRSAGLLAVSLLSLALASFADHVLAHWLGVSRTAGAGIGTYRRVGPETGPQAFCAGSSLLLWDLSWREVAESLGQGIETWGVGGSSPEIWEVAQRQRPHSSMTVIGISVYDLNEMHLSDDRARIVPLSQTLNDLRASGAEFALSRRVLTQYVLNYVRLAFPTAGDSDRILVALRRRLVRVLGQVNFEERESVLFQPSAPVLDFGELTTKVSDWSQGRLLRRITLLRAENRGRHEFLRGPKRIALHRMLCRAKEQGRVIVLVMPVARPYLEEFVDETVSAAFERALGEAMAVAPSATLIRLDRVQGISDHAYFADLVHMNTFGRRVATQAFLKELVAEYLTQRRVTSSFGASITPPAQ
jgi:hypothetical protein